MNFDQLSSLPVIALSVLGTSFLGSAHCLGMCGPIVLVVNKSVTSSFFYQIGRLSGYLFLGLLSGFVGQEILGQFPHSISALLAPLTLGLTFLYMGIMLLKHKRFHINLPSFFNKPFAKALHTQSKNSSPLSTYVIGALSITLPCGWLYGFVIGAAASKSIVIALTMMFMFWLGSIPALLITPFVFQKLVSPLRNKFPQLAAIILICLGIYIAINGVVKVL